MVSMTEHATTRPEALLPAMEALASIPARARHRVAALLNERGETEECLPMLQSLLDSISVDDLVTALSCGLGWERLCRPVASKDCGDPLHQEVLAALHAHGGTVPLQELRRRLPEEALAASRQHLEQEGWLRVMRTAEGVGHRWVVPLHAAGVAAHAWENHRAALPEVWHDDRERIEVQDYRNGFRALLRRLETAPRRDPLAVRLLLALCPAALASGDAWTVANLARRHLGGHGPEAAEASVATARLMWSAGLPELARATLRLGGASRGGGVVEAVTATLVDAPGSGERRLEAIFDLGRRCVEDEGGGSLVALTVLDAAVEAAATGHRTLARELVQVAYGLALTSAEDHLTGRCCLVEGLLHLLRDDPGAASRSLDAGLGLLEPFGVAVMVSAIVDVFAPAPLVGPSPSLRARQLVAGHLSRRVGPRAAWCHLARHAPLADGPEAFDEGVGLDPVALLHRLLGLNCATPSDAVSTVRVPLPSAGALRVEADGPGQVAVPAVGVQLEGIGCEGLTQRESEVAGLVSLGFTNEQVARRLGISRWTVVNHLRNIMRKLGCSTRVEVAREVIRAQTEPVPVSA